MTAYAIERHLSVHAFEERAASWLLQSEAENNLLLSIIEQLKANPQSYESPYLATVEENGAVVGCAFRTPPYKLGLTHMPAQAVPRLVNDVARVFDELQAVLGPEAEARAFAEAWSACRGPAWRAGTRHRIYELRSVTFPAPMPSGGLRLAGRRDHDVAVQWLEEFGREARVRTVNTATFVEAHINNKTLLLWEDAGVVCASAVYAGRTPHGVRIGFVYTPPQLRRRGYASACVAAASQRAIDAGADFCCLYTDLDNPTSNSIYQALGYRAICDVVDYDFG